MVTPAEKSAAWGYLRKHCEGPFKDTLSVPRRQALLSPAQRWYSMVFSNNGPERRVSMA